MMRSGASWSTCRRRGRSSRRRPWSSASGGPWRSWGRAPPAAAPPAARFAERPAVDEWSANEVMAHVLSAGADFGGAIIRVLDGAPPGPGMREALPADVPRRTADEWWSLLQRDREPLFARVRSADPEARIARPIQHPFFGPLNWRGTLLFLRLHGPAPPGGGNKNTPAR